MVLKLELEFCCTEFEGSGREEASLTTWKQEKKLQDRTQQSTFSSWWVTGFNWFTVSLLLTVYYSLSAISSKEHCSCNCICNPLVPTAKHPVSKQWIGKDFKNCWDAFGWDARGWDARGWACLWLGMYLVESVLGWACTWCSYQSVSPWILAAPACSKGSEESISFLLHAAPVPSAARLSPSTPISACDAAVCGNYSMISFLREFRYVGMREVESSSFSIFSPLPSDPAELGDLTSVAKGEL